MGSDLSTLRTASLSVLGKRMAVERAADPPPAKRRCFQVSFLGAPRDVQTLMEIEGRLSGELFIVGRTFQGTSLMHVCVPRMQHNSYESTGGY